MGLGQPQVPGLAEATPPDTLCVCTLNPGPRRILEPERSGLLPLPRGWDGQVLGLRSDG